MMRRAWRITAALALILSAASILLSVYLFGVIQDERARNIAANCRDVNDRHDETIRKLDEIAKRLPPPQRTRAMQNRAGTVALLNAIVPRRDCSALVHEQVNRP